MMTEPMFADLTKLARRTGVPKRELDRIVRRLVELYDPLHIYLFGSFSWGEPHWNSDLDFCVVVRTDEEAEEMEKADEAFEGFERRYTDFYLLSKRQFETYLSNPATMEHKILHEANVLYAVPDVIFDESQPLYREEHDLVNNARDSLRMAEKAIDDAEPMPRPSLYHVHQCLEMSLRAFRMFHLQPIMKTHKIYLLRQICGRIEPALKEIPGFSSHATKRLTQYYWLRYNRKIKIPVDLAGVEAEIAIARRVYEFVKHYIETTEPPTEPTVAADQDEPGPQSAEC